MFDGLEVRLRGWPDCFETDAKALATDAADVLDHCRRVGEFPRELYREMGSRGWVGPFVDPALGGLGGGVAEYCVIEETIGKTGLVPPQVSIQGERWLLDWGSDEQRDRYLGPMARGELIFSESISEKNAGSSLKDVRSTARRDGADWVLTGHKTHVNLGHHCDVTLMYAMAEEGLTAFLVDTDLPGVVSEQTDPIGMRLIPTADVVFDNVRVPAGAVLGEPGRGLDTFLTTFNVSRLGNASELIGYGRRALGDAIRYGEGRAVGDGVVTGFQGIQWTVADCYAELYAASLARNHAANIVDRGEDAALATSLAKQLAIEAAEHATNEAFALTGGHGLYTDTLFGQLLHDVKVLRVAGGSIEVLRNYVSRRVFRSENLEGLE